jgi:hypothetical protein
MVDLISHHVNPVYPVKKVPMFGKQDRDVSTLWKIAFRGFCPRYGWSEMTDAERSEEAARGKF